MGILSCPRIKNVFQADAAEILEALGPSALEVKSIHGVNWVRRRRPLPKLNKDVRPSKGQEPDWYKALHPSSDDAMGSADVVAPSSATAEDAVKPCSDPDMHRCKVCA